MRVRLLALGTRMPGWVEAGTSEYVRRLSGDIRLEIEEISLPKRGSNADTGALVAREAEALRKRLAKYPGAMTVALEVKGRRLTTEKLATELGTLRDLGQDLCILVGGPDGLCPALSAECRQQWSLSDLTLPHPLVRILVAEQVYRAWTILSGHPYHR
ncbi:ribosomal RNA large subunit methyltransferase H [Isoalcanivorax pacificus W11-5]|uniref:Ribosomal RNA large subunit methyltransferase H n=1 Tax=Isoalcanivorax pacificus W11-5 TaxID=391936 RepID=A0A0B4XS96_9GAMM|nr:23S rRNA (pseudouridine(1915)-N(3))-methyltransferase RlmH [Isoalcanivorax pacificus]AJD49142.1 ribosomal RNA large subunit methyltransferase H [Isoalcanivorax pacificus W11-5]